MFLNFLFEDPEDITPDIADEKIEKEKIERRFQQLSPLDISNSISTKDKLDLLAKLRLQIRVIKEKEKILKKELHSINQGIESERLENINKKYHQRKAVPIIVQSLFLAMYLIVTIINWGVF